MVVTKPLLAGILIFLSAFIASAQLPVPSYLDHVTLQIDTNTYSSLKDMVHFRGKDYLPFLYAKEDEVCDVKIFPSAKYHIRNISLMESADFSMVDSLVNFNNGYYTFKVQFHRLSRGEFLRFRLKISVDSATALRDIPLLPFTNTSIQLKSNNNELLAGEEKVFELVTNHPDNIVLIPEWQSAQDVEYRLTENNGQLMLHFLSSTLGNKTVLLNLQTYKPSLINNALTCDLPPVSLQFNVKTGELAFLQPDQNEFVLDETSKSEGTEFQIENNKQLQLNTAYLVTSNESPGSPVVAELYTKERLSNNKMLCVLHAYNYHRKSDGYLYITDFSSAKFITNFNIIPKVSITKIKVMRNGKDWEEDGKIYPGETFNLRLEGQSLDKAKFRFGELINLTVDSVLNNESFAEYKLKVPLNISKKTVEIYNNNQNTGKYLSVKDYQRPRPFDYVNIAYGNRRKAVTDFKGPDLYSKTISDLLISFSPEKIDSLNKLYGKQYLTVDVKILGKKDEVVDYTTIDNIAVCPGENSPRYPFYDRSDCNNAEISLNSKITNNTYDLKDWSKIKLTFQNPADKYSQTAQKKTVEIVLQKPYDFDVDVSFPTGLLIKKMNTPGYGNFGGVSMAVMGQYSFYKKDKIDQLSPFKVGAGFLALNAFDFSQDASSRDIGAVILGTLNPVNTDRKLTFSIYLGGGYLLSAKTVFWLVGPGFNLKI